MLRIGLTIVTVVLFALFVIQAVTYAQTATPTPSTTTTPTAVPTSAPSTGFGGNY